MLNNDVFYHGITRKYIVAFGALFSNIRISRVGDGVTQEIAVPIAYAPKEKWLVRLEQDPNLENNVYTTLPRLSFEISDIRYDKSRKLNKLNTITCTNQDGTTSMFAPSPWIIDMNLYAITKNNEDMFQIIEQILPFFSPDYILSLKLIPEQNIIVDTPITLNDVQISDEYDGKFENRRFVIYTLRFSIKINIYGPTQESKLISKTIVDITKEDGYIDATHTAIGDLNTGNILYDEWHENK